MCNEAADVIGTELKQMNGIGSGTDMDGSYDSGHSEVTIKCSICGEVNKMNGNVETQIKNHRLFRVYKTISNA
jgi:hypothetical protein